MCGTAPPSGDVLVLTDCARWRSHGNNLNSGNVVATPTIDVTAYPSRGFPPENCSIETLKNVAFPQCARNQLTYVSIPDL